MKWYSPLLLTGLLLVPATPAAGQTSLSLTGGINVASLEVDSSDPLVPNLQSVSRMSIGLAATIPISERVAIQLGGAYSQKGGSLEVQEDGATIASDIELDYIELTALARVGLPLVGGPGFRPSARRPGLGLPVILPSGYLGSSGHSRSHEQGQL